MSLEARKVLIVEDDELVRSSLELLIAGEEDLDVAGTAENGLVALSLLEASKPNLVLMDLRMPVMDGLTCIREIRERENAVPILILTTFNEEEYIFEGLAAGANGYLLKGLDNAALLRTIREALDQRFLLPAEVAATIAQYVLKNDVFRKEREILRFFEQTSQFTKREREIILLLIGRMSNKEIARRMFVSEGTVKNHLTSIYEKLFVQNRREAIRYLEKLASGSET